MDKKCPLTGKHCDTRKEALERAVSLIEAKPESKERLRAYKCECGFWHLGHVRKNGNVRSSAKYGKRWRSKKTKSA